MIYQLPPKGFEFLSGTKNKVYYYNPISNIGQWFPFTLDYTIELPPNWTIVKNSRDGIGKTYFYNSVTKQSSYKIPEGTVINPLEVIIDPMVAYYNTNGLPLEDYENTLKGLKSMGVNISGKNITKITEGCKKSSPEGGRSPILDFLDKLYQQSPNITQINLSNCEITSEVSEKLALFPQLKRVFSLERIKNLSPEVVNIYSPIKTWEEFNRQLLDSLSSAEQEEWVDYDWSDIDIIRGLLDMGLNPQEGYDKLIDTLIHGNRYAREYWQEGWDSGKPLYIIRMLNLFLSRGVQPNLPRLLRPEDQIEIFGNIKPNIEDEEDYTHIKGMLIDTLYEINPEYVSNGKLNMYLPSDWNSIQPDYWQETDVEDYEDVVPYDRQFWEHMKYFSTRLRQFRKNS